MMCAAFLRGQLRQLVLHALARQPLSGYDIIKRVAEETGWKPSTGSVYPLLLSLEEQGFLASRQEGRRKVYAITHTGRLKAGERPFDQYEPELDSFRQALALAMAHNIASTKMKKVLKEAAAALRKA